MANATPAPVMLRLNKAHYPVTTLGYGKRIGVWFQGCSIHCKDCVSMDTWEPNGGADIAVPALMDWCKAKAAAGGVDGVTFSGGEPFFPAQQAIEHGVQGLRLFVGGCGFFPPASCGGRRGHPGPAR
ncbi:hypothetical protein AGMMS49543_27450 [Betaproteobacteria bacterium]|nr:hypothetical protein AGMMS49543_27450 [Betaproteobacteria bacterium]